MVLLEVLSVSFFNFLLTVENMPGILERASTAFNLVTKNTFEELLGEHIYVLETFSPTTLKQSLHSQ